MMYMCDPQFWFKMMEAWTKACFSGLENTQSENEENVGISSKIKAIKEKILNQIEDKSVSDKELQMMRAELIALIDFAGEDVDTVEIDAYFSAQEIMEGKE